MPRKKNDSKSPIIVFAPYFWDSDWHTRQHILSGLAKLGWPIIYSNGIYSNWDNRRQRRQRSRSKGWLDQFINRDGVTLYWPSRFQWAIQRFKFWIQFVQRRHVKMLLKWARNQSHRPPIIYIFTPQFYSYLEHVNDAFVIYHADDNFSKMPGWSKQEIIMQSRLVQRANLVFGMSHGVMNALRDSAPCNPVFLPNGANIDMFERGLQAPCPKDLHQIPHPRICYLGNINEKVDVQLVAEIATAKPDWNWVLIGPKIGQDYYSERTKNAIQACEKLPNVHLLGYRPSEELPNYVAHMDVNTMCYRSDGDGWWKDVYPLKMHEYLAVGKPVVSSDLEAAYDFSHVICICRTTEDWVQGLSNAIENSGVGSVETRIKVARENSWDNRALYLDQQITNALEIHH